MADDTHPLEYLSTSQDLIDMNDFMQDEDFADALNIVMNCIAKPDLPLVNARRALVKMQAYAFKFKMQGQLYMTLKKGPAGTAENHRKNVYFSASEQCHELAQTLKYICKEIT